MNTEIKSIRDSLRQFSGACHRLADDSEASNDPVVKMDLQNIYKSDLQEAMAAMQRLVTAMRNGQHSDLSTQGGL